ncbi:hypothetical protein H0A36_27005 [Endozoicomonas sp. SM1973]|uniref:Uncharacterized protein n=1 Tax=Spartinivicinus marinus TaxID=2994442 RepID=A0A853IGK2_9GAMM|nr:hypothetical protein [Spartinivicinus marinus]MCX4025630.1 hypothetical protein [Spartinivicinus marinus]NYZ69668.1 hypothetical protein [Spartinivicinus marinus]
MDELEAQVNELCTDKQLVDIVKPPSSYSISAFMSEAHKDVLINAVKNTVKAMDKCITNNSRTLQNEISQSHYKNEVGENELRIIGNTVKKLCTKKGWSVIVTYKESPNDTTPHYINYVFKKIKWDI